MGKKIFTTVGIIAFFSLFGAGCSKKETPPPPAPEVKTTELPELEQNSLYKTNLLPEMMQSTPKDTSFTEVEDDLEEPPPPDPLNPPKRPTD